MELTFDRNHPTQKLLFFVAQEVRDEDRQLVRDFVEKLAASREWVIRPPKIVNDVDEPESSFTEDMPVETVGGYLEIYSAVPPLRLSREIDLQHLEEVTALVEAVRDLSQQNGLAFEFELDGKFVGSIEDGKMDRCLSEGLLGEWRRHLGVG
jgi:hypothetical protein